MNSQQLLIINFIVLLGLFLFLIFGRSKIKQHVRLNLKSNSKEPHSEDRDEKKLVLDTIHVKELKSDGVMPPKKDNGGPIYFLYNGHEWEVHEVLGLPMGSSLQIATSQYQNLIKTSDPSTFEFYDAAYSAILKSQAKNIN